MATNNLLPVVPGVALYTDLACQATATLINADYGVALNPSTPYGTFPGVGSKWLGPSTPPALPLRVAVQMWDAGTNSPDGQLPPVVTISNVTVHTFAPADGYITDVRLGVFRVGAEFLGTNFATGGDASFSWATNPDTGLAWTRADLFSYYFGIKVVAATFLPLPNFHQQRYNNGGVPALYSSSNEFAQVDIVVTYTTPPPPVTYQEALTLSGAPSIGMDGAQAAGGASLTLDTAPALDSHTGTGLVIDVPSANRWELQRFAVRPSKQGDN